jgi:hypothetical protein
LRFDLKQRTLSDPAETRRACAPGSSCVDRDSLESGGDDEVFRGSIEARDAPKRHETLRGKGEEGAARIKPEVREHLRGRNLGDGTAGGHARNSRITAWSGIHCARAGIGPIRQGCRSLGLPLAGRAAARAVMAFHAALAVVRRRVDLLRPRHGRGGDLRGRDQHDEKRSRQEPAARLVDQNGTVSGSHEGCLQESRRTRSIDGVRPTILQGQRSGVKGHPLLPETRACRRPIPGHRRARKQRVPRGSQRRVRCPCARSALDPNAGPSRIGRFRSLRFGHTEDGVVRQRGDPLALGPRRP